MNPPRRFGKIDQTARFELHEAERDEYHQANPIAFQEAGFTCEFTACLAAVDCARRRNGCSSDRDCSRPNAMTAI
jgi:hypothetical protein